MEDGSFLRMNLKITPKWAWPGSRPNSEILVPQPYNWQNIKGELQVY